MHTNNIPFCIFFFLQANKCPEYKCNNGQCIPESYVCDYESDCNDKSDENDTMCMVCTLIS